MGFRRFRVFLYPHLKFPKWTEHEAMKMKCDHITLKAYNLSKGDKTCFMLDGGKCTYLYLFFPHLVLPTHSHMGSSWDSSDGMRLKGPGRRNKVP